MQIPFFNLKKINQNLNSELQEAFLKFLDSGQYILGSEVADFETHFANYCESNYCVGLANGLDALILGLQSLDLPANSEVLVPANTYYASILSILKAGYKPVLVEPNIETFNIDSSKIESHITNNTSAILAVNLYGKMCDFEALNRICKEHDLKLIVDAAQSHGGIYDDSKKCKGADVTAYSFYPSKNLGALSDGGAIVTDNEQIYKKIKSLRNYGSSIKYQFEYQGINSRLSEIQASFLNIKLKYLNEELLRRRQIARIYLTEIKNNLITLPSKTSIDTDAWHLFVIRTSYRERFMNHLIEKKVGFEIHYPTPPHKQKALEDFNYLSLPITEKIHDEVLSIPLNSTLTNSEIAYIIDTINSFRI